MFHWDLALADSECVYPSHGKALRFRAKFEDLDDLCRSSTIMIWPMDKGHWTRILIAFKFYITWRATEL